MSKVLRQRDRVKEQALSLLRKIVEGDDDGRFTEGGDMCEKEIAAARKLLRRHERCQSSRRAIKSR